MPAGAENLKPLADAARSAARSRFSLIENDPAYKAVVNGKTSPDKFIDKYVIGSDTNKLQTMKNNLEGNDVAQQAIASGTMNHLTRAAGLIEGKGNFSQAGYNRALESIRPKLGVIFDPKTRQQVEALGNTARLTQYAPRGSFVNASNTFTAAIGNTAKNTAESMANVAAHGVPVGTWTRKIAGHFGEARAVKKSLAPGAGILLRNVGK